MNKFSLKEKGFTLIELLVVISIIGLLSSVVPAALQEARLNAKWRAFESELYEVRTRSLFVSGKDGGVA